VERRRTVKNADPVPGRYPAGDRNSKKGVVFAYTSQTPNVSISAEVVKEQLKILGLS
jgi:hypothetical protein